MTQIFKLALKNQAERAMDGLMEFTGQMLADPFHTMSGADIAFHRAAEHMVARHYLAHMEAGVSLEDIRTAIQEELLRGARWPRQSSSASSNLADQHKLAALARLLEEINQTLARRQDRREPEARNMDPDYGIEGAV